MTRNQTRTKRARREPLSRERVLAAALHMADEQGIDALSMRLLAQRLGVEAMSLYNHVAGKEDILDGLVELVVAEIRLPESTPDWRAFMRARAHAAHTVLLAHPWATMLFVSRVNIGPHMLRYVDATLGSLHGAGFSYALADHAWNTVDAYVYGFTLHKLNFPFNPDEYASAAAQFLPMVPVELYPHLRGLSEEVVAGRHDGVQELALGLELLLDGLEAIRRASVR